MKFPFIVLMFTLLLFNCSKKQNDIKTNHTSDLILDDSILFEGKYTFNRIFREDGQPIYTKEITDFYSAGGTEKKMVVKSTLFVTETPSWYPEYKLTLEGYELTNIKEPVWKKEIENESPVGIWNGYLQTVQFGCCSSEDGNTLYDLDTGNEVVKFTDRPRQAYLENVGYIFYHSVSATNFDHDQIKALDGIIYMTGPFSQNTPSLRAYTIQFTDSTYSNDVRFEHTPRFEVESKHELRYSGFFRAFNLFRKGAEMQKLDTADNYLKLVYASEHSILIPFDDQGNLLGSELVCTEKELSKYFLLSRKN
jgi:hypothetical protein